MRVRHSYESFRPGTSMFPDLTAGMWDDEHIIEDLAGEAFAEAEHSETDHEGLPGVPSLTATNAFVEVSEGEAHLAASGDGVSYAEVAVVGENVSVTAPGDIALVSEHVFLPDLPTADPESAGLLWNDSGTVRVSGGAGLAFSVEVVFPAPAAADQFDVMLPFAGTFTGWRIVADASGSAVVDVWKDTYANFPPVNADSIAGSELPTLSSAVKNEDTSLTGWTTAFSAGDWLRFNVDSASGIERLTVVLFGNRA